MGMWEAQVRAQSPAPRGLLSTMVRLDTHPTCICSRCHNKIPQELVQLQFIPRMAMIKVPGKGVFFETFKWLLSYFMLT